MALGTTWIFSFSLVSAAVLGLPDFDTSWHHNCEFIYHDTTDLMLVMHKDNCYFTAVKDGHQEDMWATHNVNLKERLCHTILTNGSGHVKPSSLQKMRDEYNDLLADFHCLNKHVFTADISHYYNQLENGSMGPHQTTHHPTSHHHHHHATTVAHSAGGSGSHGHHQTTHHPNHPHAADVDDHHRDNGEMHGQHQPNH